MKEEEIINQINEKISSIENDRLFFEIKEKLRNTQIRQEHKIAELKEYYSNNKRKRKVRRQENKTLLSELDYQNLIQDLIKQSYRDKHEFDVIKREFNAEIEVLDAELKIQLNSIEHLKSERKERSAILQQKLFDQYHFMNALKHSKSVIDIFSELNSIPPAGAGECAAPKLLQFAYLNNLKPICMAEFWWGSSPNLQVRKHQNFYPACRGKCEPILNHMLSGLLVDDNPLLVSTSENLDIEIIYEDQHIIVINKPAELLSVPGVHIQDSVQTRILEMYPEISGPLIIHRLDMSTSGLMVLAKNKFAHQFIQNQFIKHAVTKRYTAILDGTIPQKEGKIDLPLRVDLDDRPRQVVCYEYGKKAKTLFKVISIENNRTRIHYFPLSGRTHQLRVHSAHSLGLGCPI
ncbi:MAG: pseudouridine synthase, partial [Sphingobacterium sp.]